MLQSIITGEEMTIILLLFGGFLFVWIAALAGLVALTLNMYLRES
jgi:hypothetical protein